MIQQGRSNVSITTYIYNYCQEPIQIDTSQITFNLSTSGASYLCGNKLRIGENVYTCQWSTFNRTNGFYNFTMSTWEDDYYNDTELEENAFDLQTVPILKIANVTDRTESWSIPRNYSVKVIDNLDDAVTVTLYISVGAAEESYGTRCCGPAAQCPTNPGNCTNVTLEWNNVWLNNTNDCTSYAEKTATFRFVANDTELYEYTTSVPVGDFFDDDNTMYLEKADVNISYMAGNDTSTTTSIPTTFSVQVYDRDNQTFLFPQSASTRPWVYFNVTKTEGQAGTFTLVNHSRAADAQTDINGYANVTFLPDGTFNSGNQTWIAFIAPGDLCYNYNVTENFTVETDINKAPRYYNKTVNGSATVSMGWGNVWNFSVEVVDPEANNVNATLQIDYGSGWIDMATRNCTACSSRTILNFTNIDMTCAYINSSARFRFNVSDTIGNVNGTNDLTTFGILPD